MRRLLVLAALSGALGTTGCRTTSSRAWLVKAHQREFLADRIMRLDAGGQEKAADQHVLVSREGAIGGDGTAGGGCGCN
jgi:hypothetical protein